MNHEYIQEILKNLQIDQTLIDQIAKQIDDSIIDDWHEHLYYDMSATLKFEAKSKHEHLIYRSVTTIDKDSIVEQDESSCQCVASIEHFITILSQNGDTQVMTVIDHLLVDAQF
jgi:hypothetical protein